MFRSHFNLHTDAFLVCGAQENAEDVAILEKMQHVMISL